MEFSGKLKGFKEFKEMHEGEYKSQFGPAEGSHFDRTNAMRGNKDVQSNIAERGVKPEGFAKSTSIGEMNTQAGVKAGANKGFKPAGPDFAPQSTKSAGLTEPAKPANGLQTYNSNKGPQNQMKSNVMDNVKRKIQEHFGAGKNNRAASPGNIRQREISAGLAKEGFGNKPKKLVAQDDNKDNTKKQVGRNIVTSDLFGKTSEVN